MSPTAGEQPGGTPELLEPDEARRRFAWARERGHPGYLWPGLPPAALSHALSELARVAAGVLAGEVPRLEADVEGSLRALGVAGFTSGLGPLVGRWIEDGAVAAAPDASGLFGVHLEHGRRRARRLAEVLERSAAALADAGIEPLVVKSAHTAAAYFPEPGVRPSVDVDLVVEPDDLRRAEGALAAGGFELAARQHRPPKSDWLVPGSARWPRSLEVLHADSQYAVDLHGSLERNFFGVRRASPGPVDGVPSRPAKELGVAAQLLEQPALLVYLALHGSEGLDHLTLVRLVELVLVVRRDRAAGVLDPDAFVGALEATGAPGFALPALALAERLSPGTVEPRVLERVAAAAPRRMRSVLAGMAPGEAQRHDVLSMQERFMWCRTPADYLRRLAHMALPAPAGGSLRRLARLYGDRVSRLVRGTVSLRRGSR